MNHQSHTVVQLFAALRSVNAVAIERGEPGAYDLIDNDGTPYQSQWLADLLSADARQPAADTSADAPIVCAKNAHTVDIGSQQPSEVDARDAALRFAGMVLTALSSNIVGNQDIDGAALQDMALECGLVEERTVVSPCGKTCVCAEIVGFPAQCVFNTEAGRAAIAASNRP